MNFEKHLVQINGNTFMSKHMFIHYFCRTLFALRTIITKLSGITMFRKAKYILY